jgi:hypothetical protein
MTIILPEAFSYLHRAHIAMCEAAVLRAGHGRHNPPWPRLTPAKLRAVGACPGGLRAFRDVCGSSLTLTPFMCDAFAPHAPKYLDVAARLLEATGKQVAAEVAARLVRARADIGEARNAFCAWRTEQNYEATARWPLPVPEAVTPPDPHLSPERWKRLLQVAGERYEREHARALARREADYSEIDRKAAPTREAIEKAEKELGLAIMTSLAAFLD